MDFAVDRVAIGQVPPPPPHQVLFRFSLLIAAPILILAHQPINDTIILAVDSMIKYQTKKIHVRLVTNSASIGVQIQHSEPLEDS